MDDWTTNLSSNQIATLRIALSSMEPVTCAAGEEYPRWGDGDLFLIIMRCGNGDKNWRDQEKHCPGSIYYRHLDNKQRRTNL